MIKPDLTYNRHFKLMLLTGGQPPTFKQFLSIFAPNSNAQSPDQASPFLRYAFTDLSDLYHIATLPEIDFIAHCLVLASQVNDPEAEDELYKLLSLRYGMLTIQQQKEETP